MMFGKDKEPEAEATPVTDPIESGSHQDVSSVDDSDVRVTPADGINVATTQAAPAIPAAPDHPHDVRVMPPQPEPVSWEDRQREDVVISEGDPADVRVARPIETPAPAPAELASEGAGADAGQDSVTPVTES